MEVDQVLVKGRRHYIVSLSRGRNDVDLLPNQHLFILHVRGNSMNQATPEPIENGDYVILREQITAESGDIVAVEIVGVDDRTTLKRFKIESGRIFLVPESADPEFRKPMYLDHIFTKLDVSIHIRGVAVAVIEAFVTFVVNDKFKTPRPHIRLKRLSHLSADLIQTARCKRINQRPRDSSRTPRSFYFSLFTLLILTSSPASTSHP